MNTARIDASEIRFLAICPRCGGPATRTYDLAAHRDVELLVLSYYRFITLAIPVCEPCNRRRRIVAVASWVGAIGFILGGGFLVMTFALNEWSTAAAVLGVVVLAGALVARFRLDALVEWKTLGVNVTWKRGPGTPLVVRLGNAEYFRAWLVANPTASAKPRANGDLAVKTGLAKPITYRMEQQPTFDRTIPFATFVGVTVLLGLHHWYVRTRGEYIAFAMFGLPMLWMLALGGTVYPPVFYSLGKYGRSLPVGLKVVAASLGLAGFAIAFYIATVLY